MAKDNGDKAPSADEIIEALAIDLGVDEKGAKKKGKGADATAVDTVEEAGAAEKEKARAAEESKAKPEKAAPAKAEAKPAAKPAPKPALPKAAKPALPKAAKPAAPKLPSRAPAAHEEHHHDHVATQEEVAEVLDQEHGLDALFNISGEGGDPYVGEYYDPTLDDRDVKIGSGAANFVMRTGLVVLVTGLLIGGTYLAIPDDYKQDVGPLLACEDIQTQRQLRREAQRAEERRQWLAAQPKYGTLTILTRPGFSRVIVQGQPTYTEHPSRDNTLVETRSGTTFADLDIRDPYVVTISLENYVEQRIDLQPYDNPTSLWQQRTDDGAWFVEMNELLQPIPEVIEEMRLRMTSAAAPDLLGEITVRTEPEGAQVYYNNRLLVDETGIPLTTPVTFTSYPPPPLDPLAMGSGEGTGQPVAEAPREPIPVTLRATGVPIRVELEGYLPIETGVFRHMFTCFQREGVSFEAPFWEQCEYKYDTGVLQLTTPEEFHPPGEGSGDGTGQGAEAAGSASSG